MSKEQVYRIGNAINSIYDANIASVNKEIVEELQMHNEFYKKYFNMLNPDMGRKKFTYFLEQYEKIMKKPEIRKEILNYVSSACIEYDDENYNVVLMMDEDLSYIEDILYAHTKTIMSRIIRTEIFVYKVLKDCNKTYLPNKILGFIKKKFNECYVLYELFLILVNYFIDDKNVQVNTAIESSLSILKMLYGWRFLKIFDNEQLSYEEFYSVFVKPNVENLSFDKEILKTLEEVYSKI